jgi:hypothetical protein
MFEKLLEQLALGLDRRKIPYMIIGGQAVLLYGEPRFTKDIDVTLGRDADQAPELIELIKDLGWKVLVENAESFVRKTMVMPCQDPASGIRLDFIFSYSPYEKRALERVHRKRIGKAEVLFASPEDVVIHKIVAGRPRDLEDAKNLLLKNPQLDRKYIREWLEQFEQSLSKPFIEQLNNLQKPG